jgi:hypothetical protein
VLVASLSVAQTEVRQRLGRGWGCCCGCGCGWGCGWGCVVASVAVAASVAVTVSFGPACCLLCALWPCPVPCRVVLTAAAQNSKRARRPEELYGVLSELTLLEGSLGMYRTLPAHRARTHAHAGAPRRDGGAAARCGAPRRGLHPPPQPARRRHRRCQVGAARAPAGFCRVSDVWCFVSAVLSLTSLSVLVMRSLSDCLPRGRVGLCAAGAPARELVAAASDATGAIARYTAGGGALAGLGQRVVAAAAAAETQELGDALWAPVAAAARGEPAGGPSGAGVWRVASGVWCRACGVVCLCRVRCRACGVCR